MKPREPQTLQEAIVYFSDPQRAFDFAMQLRWPDGVVTCPRCEAAKNSFIKTRRLWFCYGCQKQFTLKVGTIFEDSALGLDKWMTAMWMLVNCRNGVSSHELARSLGITQKSAWFMLQRLRRALREGNLGKMGGPGSEVEVDETFVGPRAQNIHKGRKLRMRAERALVRDGDGFTARYYARTPVQGFLDRDSRKIRASVVANVKRETLQDRILNEVAHGSSVYTDQAMAYNKLQDSYVHEYVNHLDGYVRGSVHTNGLENFWSLLKRGIRGTYVAVEPFHLSRYVDEQVFRFNMRKDDNGQKISDAERFNVAMSQVLGKRLTYRELTGKSDSPHHQETGPGTEPF
jgi:transposase-like protein